MLQVRLEDIFPYDVSCNHYVEDKADLEEPDDDCIAEVTVRSHVVSLSDLVVAELVQVLHEFHGADCASLKPQSLFPSRYFFTIEDDYSYAIV